MPDYRNSSRIHSMPESIPPEFLRRKTSINELTNDEILIAYHRLQMQKYSIPSELNQEQQMQKETKTIDEKPKALTKMDDENYQEFLKIKLENEHKNSLENEKVKSSKDDDDVHVVDVKSDEIDQTQWDCNFDEFKDAISDESDESLKIPLVIIEENEMNDNALIPTVIEENLLESNVIDVKLMLSNEALQIVTNLSTSNMSLASIKSTDENGNKKRPATHKKGPAPSPPSSSSNDVIIPSDGFYFHALTKKQFKETEL